MKTIEEASKEYGIFIWSPIEGENSCRILTSMSDFEAGVAFAQSWIPIEVELPEPTDLVLLKDEFGFWDKGCMIYDDGERKFLALGLMGKIVKWRPLNRK